MYIIAGTHRNKKLVTPKGVQTRPTSAQLREAFFNICQNYISDARFLDMCAGSGGVGLEAISRGASSSTFIESHRDAVKCIYKNIESLKIQESTQVLHGDVFKMLDFLKRKKQSFEIIYADPPYHTGFQSGVCDKSLSEKLILYIDECDLLVENGIFFIEESFDYPPRIDELKTLKLINSRRMGRAILQQYEKQSDCRKL